MPAASFTPCSLACQPCTWPKYDAAVVGSTPPSSTSAAMNRMHSHSSWSLAARGALESIGRWGVTPILAVNAFHLRTPVELAPMSPDAVECMRPWMIKASRRCRRRLPPVCRCFGDSHGQSTTVPASSRTMSDRPVHSSSHADEPVSSTVNTSGFRTSSMSVAASSSARAVTLCALRAASRTPRAPCAIVGACASPWGSRAYGTSTQHSGYSALTAGLANTPLGYVLIPVGVSTSAAAVASASGAPNCIRARLLAEPPWLRPALLSPPKGGQDTRGGQHAKSPVRTKRTLRAPCPPIPRATRLLGGGQPATRPIRLDARSGSPGPWVSG